MGIYYNLSDKTFGTEDTPSQKKLNFMYYTPLGRILLKAVFASHWFAFLSGLYYSSPLSKKSLEKFINQYSVDLTHCDKDDFASFNDFFTRKESRKLTLNEDYLISPADSFMSVYTIKDNLQLDIKNRQYSISQLLKNSKYIDRFRDGICIVYRLTLSDYHRYIFTSSGNIVENTYIKGKLHTVRPMEGSCHNYFENSRNINILETTNQGLVAHIEVGAMQVGKIVNHKTKGEYSLLEEKGYFQFGGSTIIQLFEKDTITIHDEITHHSNNDTPVKIKQGERIGYVKTTKYIL